MRKLIGRFVGALALAVMSFALPAWAEEDLAFGAGKVSSFEFSGQDAVVVGVKGLTEDYFYDEDYYGATCFTDERITDAEKEDGTADDNWWCGQISELNMMYMSGWAKTAGLTSKYATVDDALDYFRANPKLIRYAKTPGDVTTVVEGTYGYDAKTGKNKFVNWFKAETKTDLSKQMKTGTVGKKFGQTLQTLLGKGEYLMQIAPVFVYPQGNPRWSDMAVTHALVCCGYILDPEVAVTSPSALTGLFIIDSDNDQDNSGGGWNAPNSIIYCPVEWDSGEGAYVIYSLWGDSPAYLYSDMSYEALKNNKPASVTITFDGNGAEDYEKEVREYEVGDVYGEFPEVYRDEEKYTFLGWYTAKTKGTKLTEESVVLTKSGTVYAQWEEIKAHTLTVKNGYIYTYDEETGEEKYVKSLKVYPGEEVTVDFDYTLIYDEKTGDEHGAFQGWSVSDSSIDLGEYFEATGQSVMIVMPNQDVTLTGNYIANVAGYLLFGAEEIGEGDAASFYWSIDGGATKIPCDDGETVMPVAAGTVTVSFYAIDDETGKASSAWYAPASKTYKVATSAEGYEEIYETVRFVAKDGSKAVTFDANGGSVSPSSMYFIDGGEYYELPVPTRVGYIFNGWYTAKTGGEMVSEGDSVDFGMLASKPTLYAQWLKAYTLTVKTAQTVSSKGFAPEIYVNGELYESAVSIMQGDYASLVAPESACDADEEEYVFKAWTVSTKGDLGEDFDAESCDTAIVMPEADVTLTATYRPRYVKVPVTITGGFTTDPDSGESVAKATLYAGETADLLFDSDKLVDAKSGETIGAFQRWVWEPATVTAEELGEDFDMFNPETAFVVPDVSGTKAKAFKITAQYVSPVAGYVSYEFGVEGSAEEEAVFYWSPDGGKTLIPSGQVYPLAAGTIKALAFHAKDYEGATSAYWKAPASASLTIPKRGFYKEGGVTYYEEPTYLQETEWFVAADGAQQIYFNANGGKCAVASRWYLDGEMGGTYYTLPTPAARSGYVFDGWQTAKSGGETVLLGDPVDFSLLETKKPTLYARWLKAYTLTLKGTDVTAVYQDETYTKSVSVLEGGTVTLTAPDSYEDAQGNYYLFQCWTPSSAKVDLGTDYMASSCETTIVMPAAKLTMTATYIKESEAAWVTMSATGATVETGSVTVEPDPSQFYWSTDGKTWFQSGTTALVKKGTYTIQWKSTSNVWAAPTTKTKISVAAGDEYDNGEDPAVFTFVMAASVRAVVYENGNWYESTEGGTVAVNPTDGKLVSGKSITMTAKANKGYVFVGWQHEKEWDFGLSPWSTKEKYTTSYLSEYYLDEEDYTVHFHAVFRPISDYTEEGMYNAFSYVYSNCNSYEPSYDGDPLAGTVELQAAVGCEASFQFETLAIAKPLTYKQTGNLPAGLKLNSEAAEYGYFVLSGTPTAAGTYNFTVTATDPAGNACSLAVTLTVRKLSFDGVAGEYRALMTEGEGGAIAGLLEMSVTSAGKVSAKITTTAGGTISLTPSLQWCADANDSEGDGTYRIYYYKYSGNETSGSCVYFDADFASEEAGSGYAYYTAYTYKNGTIVSSTLSSMSGSLIGSDQSWLSDPDFAEAFLGKYYTVQLTAAADEESEDSESSVSYRTPTELMAPGYLTITTDKKGAVKVAGKLPDGEKISASTVLLPYDSSSASAILMVVPSSYKKKGCAALQLEFSSDGCVSSSLGTWITPPLMTEISGCEYCSEDERFLSGKLALSAYGTVYSALSDLTDYYMSLWVTTGEVAPELEYTYTEEKQKMYDYAAPVLTEFGIEGEEMLKGGKGGKITVGKSGTPWKQSDGTYNYDETKSGDAITNPAGLTISFKSATGIFSGSFKLYFDYETTKMEHKEVKCSYEGVLINDGSQAYGVGSAVYSGKYTYQYETSAGKAATKTYTQKYALPVSWSLSE